MKGSRHLAGLTAAAGAALVLLLGAADRPSMLSKVSGGLWEVSVSGRGDRVRRLCLADPAVLAQYEHRSDSCTRVVIRDNPTEAEIHYTCAGGGFGRSTVTLVTPRSLRIETQGISDQVPFHYVVQARRERAC